MALPTLTPEKRQAALAKASQARKARSELLAALKSGTISMGEVLAPRGRRSEKDQGSGRGEGAAGVRPGQGLQGAGPGRHP